MSCAWPGRRGGASGVQGHCPSRSGVQGHCPSRRGASGVQGQCPSRSGVQGHCPSRRRVRAAQPARPPRRRGSLRRARTLGCSHAGQRRGSGGRLRALRRHSPGVPGAQASARLRRRGEPDSSGSGRVAAAGPAGCLPSSGSFPCGEVQAGGGWPRGVGGCTPERPFHYPGHGWEAQGLDTTKVVMGPEGP